jgi:hypothetical protein
MMNSLDSTRIGLNDSLSLSSARVLSLVSLQYHARRYANYYAELYRRGIFYAGMEYSRTKKTLALTQTRRAVDLCVRFGY